LQIFADSFIHMDGAKFNVLILKHGYEGLGCFRSLLVSTGTVVAVCLPSFVGTEPRSGYYFWLAAFVLSTAAHWLLYTRSGNLDSSDIPLCD